MLKQNMRKFNALWINSIHDLHPTQSESKTTSEVDDIYGARTN
jgi:hypothetical protein